MTHLSWLEQLRDFFWSDPLLGVTLAVAVIAFATTPIVFAVLGRLNWFQARRGRTLQRPSFVSIVCSMLLVMGIPAIYCALVIKSRHFDKNRYEFDPNQTFTVIDQGRAYHDREEIEKAIKAEMGRLASERKALVEGLKKLDEAMLALRAGAPQSAAVAQALPSVFQKLAVLHKAVGLDAPQQIQDETAPPVELRALTGASAPAQPLVASAPSPAPSPALAAPVAPGSLSP
ncbi:MAG TPA: hypothetical protein VGY53_11420, partial [Isosphaeraceae bacterium]|nr:hypothetical protein [Isosphaeraceae bacterium]